MNYHSKGYKTQLTREKVCAVESRVSRAKASAVEWQGTPLTQLAADCGSTCNTLTTRALIRPVPMAFTGACGVSPSVCAPKLDSSLPEGSTNHITTLLVRTLRAEWTTPIREQ